VGQEQGFVQPDAGANSRVRRSLSVAATAGVRLGGAMGEM